MSRRCNKRRKKAKMVKNKHIDNTRVSSVKGSFLVKLKQSVLGLKNMIVWIAVTMGVVTFAGDFTYEFLTGDVEVKFIKPLGIGYEFKLINHSSTEQVIKSFRVIPEYKQDLLYKLTDDVEGVITSEGIVLPGGGVSYIPAAEFKALMDLQLKQNLIKGLDFHPCLLGRT